MQRNLSVVSVTVVIIIERWERCVGPAPVPSSAPDSLCRRRTQLCLANPGLCCPWPQQAGSRYATTLLPRCGT